MADNSSHRPKSITLKNYRPADVPGAVAYALQSIRLWRGLTLRELGKMVDLSPQAINHLESRRRAVTVERLAELAEALKYSLVILLRPNDGPPGRAECDQIRGEISEQLGAVDNRDNLEIIQAVVRLAAEERSSVDDGGREHAQRQLLAVQAMLDVWRT